MRIHIDLLPSKKLVPYDHLPQLVGSIHKWLGPNNPHHGQLSLHSFSWLQGGVGHKAGNESGLQFPGGGSFFFSSYQDSLCHSLTNGIFSDPTLLDGLMVHQLEIEPTPVFPSLQLFQACSPILVSRDKTEQDVSSPHKKRYLTYLDAESNALLTATLVKKLDLAGLDSSGVQVRFEPGVIKNRVKYLVYKKVYIEASLCPVLIKGTPQQLAFAWEVGIGQSTGIGFGAIKPFGKR